MIKFKKLLIILVILFLQLGSYGYVSSAPSNSSRAGYVIAKKGTTLKILNLEKNKNTRIVIPQQALVVRDGIPGVFVIENDQARFRMVRQGKTFRKSFTILAGLFGNEKIIISNVSQLYDGIVIKNND